MTLPTELDAARGPEPDGVPAADPPADSTGTAISVQGLRKSYGEASVLDGIDLRVERGTVLALLGPNGAGKTTMVRIMSTLLAADAASDHGRPGCGPRTTRGA